MKSYRCRRARITYPSRRTLCTSNRCCELPRVCVDSCYLMFWRPMSLFHSNLSTQFCYSSKHKNMIALSMLWSKAAKQMEILQISICVDHGGTEWRMYVWVVKDIRVRMLHIHGRLKDVLKESSADKFQKNVLYTLGRKGPKGGFPEKNYNICVVKLHFFPVRDH